MQLKRLIPGGPHKPLEEENKRASPQSNLTQKRNKEISKPSLAQRKKESGNAQANKTAGSRHTGTPDNRVIGDQIFSSMFNKVTEILKRSKI